MASFKQMCLSDSNKTETDANDGFKEEENRGKCRKKKRQNVERSKDKKKER